MDAAALTAVVLLALGVLFVLTELVFGSDGSLSVLALLCWVAAAWFAWEAWANPMGWNGWAYVLAVFLGIPAAAGCILTALPHSPAGRKLFSVPDPDEIRPISEEQDLWRESLIGELAKSLTLMNPGGLILVDGERQHAESEGLPIEPDQMIEIIDVRSNRFIVRLYEGTRPASEALPKPDNLAY
jgi:membrane-bound ClpP family serine protease